MTASTLTLLSPSTSSFKFTSPFFADRNMDGSEMDYLNSMGMSDNIANSSLGQPIQRRHLLVDMPTAESLQTPDFRPDDKNPFSIYHPITPSSEFPTPTIQHMLVDRHPLETMNTQIDALPEPVEAAQQEYNESMNQQRQPPQPETQLHQLHPSDQSTLSGYHYEPHINTMAPSPGDSHSSHSSSPSYSHDDHSGDQYISNSPGQQRSASATGMSSGNYGSSGSRKSGRPTKKQQYDQMVERKKNMEMENQKLKRKADEYTLACKKLREKLLTLIQNNRAVGQVM